jgi:hypothetical protein
LLPRAKIVLPLLTALSLFVLNCYFSFSDFLFPSNFIPLYHPFYAQMAVIKWPCNSG